jgi:hypothetical protein
MEGGSHFMSDRLDNATEIAVADILYGAWPCYIHYLDPTQIWYLTDTPDFDYAMDLLAIIEDLETQPDYGLRPKAIPLTVRVTRDMAKGNEHHLACVTLATALTRAIQAVNQAVSNGEWTHIPADTYPYALRRAVSDAYIRYDDQNPASDPVHRTLTVAALTQPEEQPIEAGHDWAYMVRLTSNAGHNAIYNATEYMPMRCFTALEEARAWALVQCVWECQILDEPAHLQTPGYRKVMEEVAAFDATSGSWYLASTGATLHITSRATPWSDKHHRRSTD